MILFYLAVIGHVISAGLDKKVMSWDTRLANPLALFRNLGAEYWFHFYLRVWFDSSCWSSSKYIWLVRNYERAVDLKEPFMDVGIKLHCFSSIYYNDNVIFIILNMQFLVENFFSRNVIIIRTYWFLKSESTKL